MSEVLNNLVSNTTFLTIMSGVLVYIRSQFYLENIINPQKKYRDLRERIIYTQNSHSLLDLSILYNYTNPYLLFLCINCV